MTLSEPQFYTFVSREVQNDKTLAEKPAIRNYLTLDGNPRSPGPVRRRLAREAATALVEVSRTYASFPQLQGFR